MISFLVLSFILCLQTFIDKDLKNLKARRFNPSYFCIFVTFLYRLVFNPIKSTTTNTALFLRDIIMQREYCARFSIDQVYTGLMMTSCAMK